MSTTKFEDLPLHYKHPSQNGTLVISFAVNDKDDVIDNFYFWAIQLDTGETTDHGTIRGLKKVNEIRNSFIGDGWRRFLPPKVTTKQDEDLNRTQRRAKAKLDKKTKQLVNADARREERKNKQAEERRKAFERVRADVKRSTFTNPEKDLTNN